MDNTYPVIQILTELYKDNLTILNSHNLQLLEKNSELNSLFNSFTLSNERLKNIINTIKVLESN